MQTPMWLRLCAVLVTAAAVVGAAAAVMVVRDRAALGEEARALERLAARYAAAGDDARAAGDLPMAGRAYSSAIELDPSDEQVRGKLADVHIEQALTDSSLLDDATAARLQLELSEQILARGRDAKRLAAYGKVLLYRGKADAARARLREAVELDGELAAAHIFLADALLRAEEYTGAAASAERALSIAPDDGLAHFAMGKAQSGLEQLDLAARHFRASAEALDEPGAWQALGQVEVEREKWAEAEAAFAKVLQKRPDANAVYGEYGRVLAEVGKLQPAARYLERAYEQTGDLVAYDRLGMVAMEAKDHKAAVKIFTELMRARPNDGEMACKLGAALEAAKQFEPALAAFTRCAQSLHGIEGKAQVAQAASARVEAMRKAIEEKGGGKKK